MKPEHSRYYARCLQSFRGMVSQEGFTMTDSEASDLMADFIMAVQQEGSTPATLPDRFRIILTASGEGADFGIE